MKLIQYLSLDFKLGENTNRSVFLIPFIVAIIVRLFYHLLNIPDFWGDSYHSMYISWATLENNWVYSDYKGREVVWLPFYRYLSTLFLFLFQKHDLIIPHVLNMILGSVTCGLIARFACKFTDHKIGILAGLLLAVSPWHVAYSHMNMPEITALLLLTLGLMVWSDNKVWWLIPIGFASVLTRNELTTLLGVFGLVLLIKKEWKAAGALFIGSVIGLGLWAWWNVIKRGELTWWIESRSRGSSWDRYFVITQGTYFNDWYIHLGIFITIFPVILAIIAYPKVFKKAIAETSIWKSKETLAMISILIFHWLFLLVMQTEYFTAPNGRYWLYSLPLACICFGIFVYHIEEKYKKKFIAVSTSVSIGILVFMMVVFYHQRKIYAYNMELGKQIAREVPSDTNMWLDFPDILYFSAINYERVYSSDQIMPMEFRYISDEDKITFLTDKFESLNIGYLVSSPVSYSIILSLWPQMKDMGAFEWGSYKFTPTFSKFNTKDQIIGQPMADWMRYLGGVNKKSVLWKIEKINNRISN